MSNIKKSSGDVLHNLYVRMHRSNLPGAKGRWFARTVNNRVLSIDEVCSSLNERGGGTGSYDVTVNHVKQYFDETAFLLADGFAIDTGYYTIYPVIRGSFKNQHEAIDRNTHQVEFHFRARAPLRRLAGLVKFTVKDRAGAGFIESVTDMESGTINGRLTPGGIFIAAGTKIKIEGDKAKCGMWFVSTADPKQRYKVTMTLARNSAREIISIVPALPAGKYTIEITTRYKTGGGMLKDPRTVKGGFSLTVQ